MHTEYCFHEGVTRCIRKGVKRYISAWFSVGRTFFGAVTLLGIGHPRIGFSGLQIRTVQHAATPKSYGHVAISARSHPATAKFVPGEHFPVRYDGL